LAFVSGSGTAAVDTLWVYTTQKASIKEPGSLGWDAMGLGERLRRIWTAAGGEPRPDGLDELHVGDAAYDQWDIVRDFGELETGRAFRQSLTDPGVDAVLTSDWPLDQWGRGDISLRVPPGQGTEAEDLLDSE
jgi:hypothetical protein